MCNVVHIEHLIEEGALNNWHDLKVVVHQIDKAALAIIRNDFFKYAFAVSLEAFLHGKRMVRAMTLPQFDCDGSNGLRAITERQKMAHKCAFDQIEKAQNSLPGNPWKVPL